VPDTIDLQEIKAAFREINEKIKTENIEINEETTKIRYVIPLLRLLGWNVESDEVLPEQRTLSGPVDFGLAIDKITVLHVEVKPLGANLDGYRNIRGEKQFFPEQAIQYAWHQKLDWVVLTNFKETRLYYSHVKNPRDGLIFSIRHHMLNTDDELKKLLILHKDNIKNGSLASLNKRRTRADINIEILRDLYDCRVLLNKDINQNQRLTIDEIKESVQILLDRFVVIRFAEDRQIIPQDSLYETIQHWNKVTLNKDVRTLMIDLKNSFRDYDSVYNSKLFAPHICEDLTISNDVLLTVINKLYEYNFDIIDTDILGGIYEDYLGYIIKESKDGLEVVKNEVHRQDFGIYYTPIPIVEFVVRKALEPYFDPIYQKSVLLLSEDKYEEAKEEMNKVQNIKILDSSCGSGSFLIRSFDIIKEYYEKYNRQVDSIYQKKKTLNILPAKLDGFEKSILINNLHGVDIDNQAIKLASVNLMLKSLKRGEKLPMLLEDTLRCGNSLLNCTGELKQELNIAEDQVNFPWNNEFDVIMTNGGFDVVLGNPPWGADLLSIKPYLEREGTEYKLATGQYDSYELFIELGLNLLNEEGTLSYIIPDSIFQPEHLPLRKEIMEHQPCHIIKLGEGMFKDVFRGTALLEVKKKQNQEKKVLCAVIRKEDRDRILNYNLKDTLMEIVAKNGHERTQDSFTFRGSLEFDVNTTEYDIDIVKKIEQDNLSWEDYDSGRGVELGKEGMVLKCPNCMKWDTYPSCKKGGGFNKKTCLNCNTVYTEVESPLKSVIIKENMTGREDWKSIIIGESVNRYIITTNLFIKTGLDGINYKNISQYTSPKLLVRKTGIGIYASIDYENRLTNQVVFIFQKKETATHDLEYLLACLSSRLMLFYYYVSFGEMEWKSFPYITTHVIKKLPIKKVNFNDQGQKEKYDWIIQKVREVVQSGKPIDPDTDWEIEKRIMDLYGISAGEKKRIWEVIQSADRLKIVREMFPE
jgi:type I restriction-modification system DNA methylase subunit